MAAIEGSGSVIGLQLTTPSHAESPWRDDVCSNGRAPPHLVHLSFLVEQRCNAIVRQLPS
jgi:hypothetical protein